MYNKDFSNGMLTAWFTDGVSHNDIEAFIADIIDIRVFETKEALDKFNIEVRKREFFPSTKKYKNYYRWASKEMMDSLKQK